MLRSLKWRRVWPWLAAIAFVVGIGVATYLFSGLLTPKKTSVPATRLRYVTAPKAGGFTHAQVLRLAWGKGETDLWPKQPDQGQSLEAMFVGDGGIYIVDHPATHNGARVRRFSADGRLEKTVLTPPGSTLFTPRRSGGFMYDLSKSSSPAEQVVLVDSDGNRVATYTVPLDVNAGGLIEHGDRLYAVGVESSQDPLKQTLSERDSLVPIMVGGKQVTDAEARNNVVQGGLLGLDGKIYRRQRDQKGGASAVDEQKIAPQGARAVVLPGTATPVGVDVKSRLYLLLAPRAISVDSLVPEWPATYEYQQELLVVKPDGRIDAALVVPNAAELRKTRMRMFLDASGLYVPDADARGVTIWRYHEEEGR